MFAVPGFSIRILYTTKATWKKTFTDFLQTAKVYPTNFISAILSANSYIATQKVVFMLIKSKTTKVFPTL